MIFHELGKHQPRHRRAGLVGPAEGPPDFVFRFCFRCVVCNGGIARRVQPDRLVELFHRREERLERRVVERLAGDVGINLHAERAILDRAGSLRHADIGCAERALRHPAGEMVAVLGADLGQFVVDQPGIFLDLGAVARISLRLGEDFERRHGVGDNLRVVGEGVDHFAAGIEIVDAGHLTHALADVRIAAVDQQLEHPARHEMGIGVDTHGTLRDWISCLVIVPNATGLAFNRA